MDLFVYGTLMNDALAVELTGRDFRKERARLPGYRKIMPEGDYPVHSPRRCRNRGRPGPARRR